MSLSGPRGRFSLGLFQRGPINHRFLRTSGTHLFYGIVYLFLFKIGHTELYYFYHGINRCR